jgi:hypothetical protein
MGTYPGVGTFPGHYRLGIINQVRDGHFSFPILQPVTIIIGHTFRVDTV